MSRSSKCVLIGVVTVLIGSIRPRPVTSEDKKPAQPAKKDPFPSGKWVSLFDGKTLKGWKITKFGGEGKVTTKKGILTMYLGTDLTGVTSTRKDLPTTNYEVKLEAQRVQGGDFFCGLTFPIDTKDKKGKKKTSYASLICGGWGGGVCGISSLDSLDASENETTTYREFTKKTWYTIRLRVTGKKIEAWIGKKQIVNQSIEDKKVNVRAEVELSRPFGLSTWQTTGAARNIQLRRLPAKEVKALYAKWAKEE